MQRPRHPFDFAKFNKSLDKICDGCEKKATSICANTKCYIEFARWAVLQPITHKKKNISDGKKILNKIRDTKSYDRGLVIKSYAIILGQCKNCGTEHQTSCVACLAKEALEKILGIPSFSFNGNIEEYLECIGSEDPALAEMVKSQF